MHPEGRDHYPSPRGGGAGASLNRVPYEEYPDDGIDGPHEPDYVVPEADIPRARRPPQPQLRNRRLNHDGGGAAAGGDLRLDVDGGGPGPGPDSQWTTDESSSRIVNTLDHMRFCDQTVGEFLGEHQDCTFPEMLDILKGSGKLIRRRYLREQQLAAETYAAVGRKGELKKSAG